MEIVLDSAKDFKKSVDAIAVLIDEAEFVVSEEGLELKATDPSQISMVDFKLDKKHFKKFEVNEKVKIGIDLDYLAQIMARAKTNDELFLALNPEKTVLLVEFVGKSKRNFSIPLIDISKSDVPTPKIEFDAEVKLDASIFQDALKDASLISTHVSVGVNDKSFFVRASSSKGTLNSETGKKELKEFNVKTESQSMFPLDYLQDMIKTADATSEIIINIKSDAPILVSYLIGKASVSYFLAPRIEK